MGQLCHPSEDRLLGQNEIENKFSIRTNFLETLLIRNNIPHEWRQTLNKDFEGDHDIKYEIHIQDTSLDIVTRHKKECYRALVAEKKNTIREKKVGQGS